jgi:predicted permease
MLRLLRHLRARVRYRHFEHDLAEEIEFHRAMKEAELRAGGLAPSDARAAAARALGNVTLMREDARSVWIARWLEHGWQDLRYAVRGLRRQPGFAATAIGILGVSTGLLTTLVVFADASLLQPWRVPDAGRIRLIRPAGPSSDGFAGMRVPEYLALRSELTSWTSLSLTLRGPDQNVTFDNGATDRVDTLYVSSDYFETLDLRLARGRGFTAEDDAFDSPAGVAVISHRLWRTHLGSDPAAIGRHVRLGSRPFTIVGVTPDGFLDGHGSRREIWVPLSMWLDGRSLEERRAYLDPRHPSTPLNVVGRMASGVSDERAAAELNAFTTAYRREAGLEIPGYRLLDTRPISRSSLAADEDVQILALVALALVMVQLLACTNVGNLLLARALARQREIAVRLALGAGRRRIVLQLLTESSVLILLSTALGLLIASLAARFVVNLIPEMGERPEYFVPGVATFTVLAGAGALSTLAAGLAPALRATRTSMFALASHRQSHTRGGLGLQQALLGAQIVLATILLSGAGLLTQAVRHALASDPGFRVEEFHEVSFSLPGRFDRDRQVAFHTRMYEQTRSAAWPEIAFTDFHPIDDAPTSLVLHVPDGSGTRLESVLSRPVSTNYFDVLGVGLLAGRMPAPGSGGREIVINRRAADLLWPGEDPLGKSIATGSRSDSLITRVVVGLAPDLPGRTIADRRPIAYPSSNFAGSHGAHFIVRSTDRRASARLETLASSLEPGVVTTSAPLAESVAETMLPARMGGMVAWAIGALALALATVGAFGVFAYAVEQRRRELGIRMALGARAREVIWHVVRSTQLPLLAGLTLGVGIAAAGAPLLGAHLYGLSPFDPVAYVQVAATLAAASALATWAPARRATRVNPAEVLRAE